LEDEEMAESREEDWGIWAVREEEEGLLLASLDSPSSSSTT
jgi:hypothetical protein